MMQFFSKKNYPEIEGMELKHKIIEYSGSVEFSLCFEDRKIIYYITTSIKEDKQALLQFCIQPSTGEDCIFDNIMESFKAGAINQEFIDNCPTFFSLVFGSKESNTYLMKFHDVTGGNEISNESWQYFTILENFEIKDFGEDYIIEKVFESYGILVQLLTEIDENRDLIYSV